MDQTKPLSTTGRKKQSYHMMAVNGYTSPLLLTPPPIETSNFLFATDLHHYKPRDCIPSYELLDIDREEIRPLVFPCPGSDSQENEFIHVSLLTNIKYEALFYA